MAAYTLEDRIKLCQRITFLPGPRLKEILDLLRRINPGALKYVDSQWVFDTRHMDDNVLKEIESTVDKYHRTTPVGLAKSSSLDYIQLQSPRAKASTAKEPAPPDRPSSRKRQRSNTSKAKALAEETTFKLSGVTITVQDSGRMSCGICKKEFRVRSEVVVHVRTHTGEKPLSCSECGKTFAHPSNLKAHERSHRGEKPYKCMHPGCGKSFAHSATLRDHGYKHSSKKPYTCSICSKGFSTKAYLKKHERNHAVSGKGKRTD